MCNKADHSVEVNEKLVERKDSMKKHISVVIQDAGQRMQVVEALTVLYGPKNVRAFTSLQQLDTTRFSEQLIPVDVLVLAPVDGSPALADYLASARASASAARIVLLYVPGTALTLENQDCCVIPFDAMFTKRIDAILQQQ